MADCSKNKREAILFAALDLFAKKGFHSSPVSRLAALAGVGVGTVYRYFRDKDTLIHAVYKEVDTPLQQVMAESLDSTLSDRLQFIQFVTRLIYYLDAHPKEFKFLEQYYSSPYGIDKIHAKFWKEGKAEQTGPFASLFSTKQNKTIKKLPLPLYLAMTFGPVSYLIRYSLSGYITLNDVLIRGVAEACWNAIKA